MPKVAQASFFDIINTLFAKEPEQKQDKVTVQNLSLLSPVDTVYKNEPSSEIGLDPEEGLLSVSSGPLRMSTEKEVYIPDSSSISVYVVKDGDTLNSIAKLFDVSVNTIVWANNISSRKVSPGDVLTILPVSGLKYSAQNGDTLSTIAKKYNADAEEIALFNGLAVDANLSKGETIIIPDGEIEEVKPEKPVKEKPKAKIVNKVTKVVKSLTKSSNGSLIRPISGGLRTTGLHGHNAVDLAAPVGTSIYAAASGTVITVKTGGYNGGYGNYIVISHSNGTQTLYAHTSANYVIPGQTVSQGQVIGAVGSTGKSTGPHVHFEVRGGVNPF